MHLHTGRTMLGPPRLKKAKSNFFTNRNILHTLKKEPLNIMLLHTSRTVDGPWIKMVRVVSRIFDASCSTGVAEPPELSRLKCAGHHHKDNTGSNALQTEQFLVCRVTSRYNHRFSDRTSIPRTKASPEILQPQFYNTSKVVITNQFKPLLQNQL